MGWHEPQPGCHLPRMSQLEPHGWTYRVLLSPPRHQPWGEGSAGAGRGLSSTSDHGKQSTLPEVALPPAAIPSQFAALGNAMELMPEYFKAFPASAWGFSPTTAAVGLTTSLQPGGGALPRAEPNVRLSDPKKCFPLTSFHQGLGGFFWSRTRQPGSLFSCGSWG